MKIEWASNFRADGTRRRPPPSSMHGWLAKMRGTLLGNEELRSKGMREMRDATRQKRTIAQVKQQRSAKSGGPLFSFLGITKGKPSKPPTVISKRSRTMSPKPPSHRSRASQSSRQTRASVRSPVTSPGRPSPRHRPTGSSYKSNRMPGHYPEQKMRRATT